MEMGHRVKAFFPDAGFPGPEKEKYYGDSNYYIVPFPAEHQGINLYTFPLIITDPNPRNYEDAWTFKNLSDDELSAYLDYMKKHLKQVIEDFQPHVIECQHIWAIDHLVKELGHSYICVAHHSDQLGFLYDSRMRKIALESASEAHYIFAISEFVRDELIELYNVPADKVITIPNGYDDRIFRPLKVNKKEVLTKLGVNKNSNQFIISFSGKISTTKGIDVLLKANNQIQEELNALVLVAGSGNIQKLPHQSSFCLDNVHFLGHRTHQELAILHNISHVNVLPSRSEGFGISALEAMGCGTPVVATEVGGLRQFAVGDIVKPEDPESLAESVIKILKMGKKEYDKLCEQALKKAEKHSWRGVVKKRLPYYRELAYSKKPKT